MVAESRIQIGNSVVRAQRWIETCPPAAKLAARVVVGAMPQLLAWTLDFWHWVSLCPCASLASKTSIADFGNMGSLSIERERLSFFCPSPLPFRRVYGLESYSRTSGESNHRGGPHMRSLISIDFPNFRPQKWNLGAHMWYQLSPFPGSNAAIAMQHHPGNIHQSFATPRYSATPCYASIQLPNAIDTISKRWRSKKASNTSPSHIFPQANSYSIPF